MEEANSPNKKNVSEEDSIKKEVIDKNETPPPSSNNKKSIASIEKDNSMKEKVIPTNTQQSSQSTNKKQITNKDLYIQKGKDLSSQKEIEPLLKVALEEIERGRNELKKEIEELSSKKSQIEAELKSSFIGQSDAIARKLKGFQDYLNGALQDLVQSAEQLELVVQPVVVQPSPLDEISKTPPKQEAEKALAVADTFSPDEGLIRDCLEQFLDQPDFYADPWKFRRSLDHSDKELLEDWFFNMGGRGAQPSRGNRGKNVLLAAALIAILGELYGDRFQTLILASQPERLGEWRRGLQDALGLGREDFGPNSGIVLFERGDGLVEKADRLEERDEVPLILIDAAEQSIDIPILQFPLWLAFAASPEELYEEEELI
tara:strand:+ start:5248 stop:6369 length:1122 start_codon:yes stop_codon:yes gene_type:complete